MNTLEAKNITFNYGRQTILDDCCLTIKSGQQLGLLAPSGWGKTTLLTILGGYRQPQKGQVLLNGQSLDFYRGACPVQLIWQHPEQALDPYLRIGDSLAEGGAFAQKTLTRLGIETDWLQRYPSQLSGGQLQRICLLRALGEQTQFVLADEISASLDALAQAQLWQFLLAQVQKRQLGLLVVSHDELFLASVCDQVIRGDDL